MSSPSANTRKRKPDVELEETEVPTKRAGLTIEPSASTTDPPVTRKSSTTSTVSTGDKPAPASTTTRLDSPPWFASPSGADYPESLRARLPTLLNLSRPPSNRFAMHVVPSGLKWPKQGDDSLLVHEGRPITVLLIGEITKHFLHKNGKPIKFVSINLRLLDNADHQAATTLLEDQSQFTPPPDAPKIQVDTSIRASCPTSRKDRHGLVETYLFNEVYDARTGYGPKSSMPSYAVDRVGTNDLVIAECTVQRYHVDATGAIEYGVTGWSRWKAGYQLLAFSVLHIGAVPTPPPPVSFTDDDMPMI